MERELLTRPQRDAARRRFDQGASAWPGIALAFETFEQYFARHATEESAPDEVHAADMYLACACSVGVESALGALERTLSVDVARAVGSIDSSHAFVEEALQATRERLLVARPGEVGRIADYAGRASLRSWLCAVAVRWAISQRRRKSEQRHTSLDTHEDRRLAKGGGPEFDFLRRRYKIAFEDAVRRAIKALPPGQRLLLRLNVVDGLSVDKIAVVYRIGRSTAARRLAGARRELHERVRSDLRARLRVTSTELDSLGGEIQSHLEVSLVKLLARTNDSRDNR